MNDDQNKERKGQLEGWFLLELFGHTKIAGKVSGARGAVQRGNRMTAPTLFQIDTGKSAIISPCGRYRYRLERIWQPDRPQLCWIMLNPSTADAQKDDHTIRKIVKFSRTWGYGGLVVVNLFALRSPSPAVLHKDPAAAVGAENDQHIRQALHDRRIVAAWGIHGPLAGRDKQVIRLLGDRRVHCLGTTDGGQPRHPLYLADDTKPRVFLPGIKGTESI